MKPADQRSRRTKWTLKCLLLINGSRHCRRRKKLFLSFDQILTVFVASILKQKSTNKKRKKKDVALWIFSFDYYFSNLFCDVVMNRFNVTPVGDSKRGGLIRDARKVAQRTREWEKTKFFSPTRLHHHWKFVLNHTYTLSQLFAF